MIEVTVARTQNQIVLENQRCDPHVIRGNRRSLFSQLPKQCCVMVSRLIVRKENIDTVLHQEASQYSLVVSLLSSIRETSSELGQNDERQDHCLGFFKNIGGFGIASTKVNVSVRVDGDSHF